MPSNRETDSGVYPQTNDDGSYVEEKFGAGWVLIHPDGHTVTNLRDGTTYDLAEIGTATDSDIQDAINNDSDHGSTAPHNYFSGDHADLTNVGADQHHAKTTTVDELADMVVDTESNLPSPGDTDRIAFVYDQQEIQRDTGSAWETIANVSSGGGGSVSDDGTQVVAEPSDVNYRKLLSVSDDGDGTATVNLEESRISHDNIADVSKGDHRTDEQIEDLVAALLTAQGNISITQDDANDQILVDTSALNQEEVEDTVASLVAADTNLAWNYDDANDILTVSLSGPITGVQIGTDANRQPGYFSSVTTEQAKIDSKLITVRNDAELSDALSQAESGGIIHLLPGDYSGRTVSKKVQFYGSGFFAASVLSGTWTFDKAVRLCGVNLSPDCTANLNGNAYQVTHSQASGSSEINVDANDGIIGSLINGNVTFVSGTSGNIVDCSTLVSVTDNGSNTVGDIA